MTHSQNGATSAYASWRKTRQYDAAPGSPARLLWRKKECKKEDGIEPTVYIWANTTSTMKALFFDGKTLQIKSNHPEPKDGEAKIKVSLAGICGTDLELVRGYMSYTGVLGHEFVGVVIDAGNKSLVGKRVVGEINAGCGVCNSCKLGLERHCPNRTVLGILGRDGAFAEYISLPERNLHVIPDLVSDEQAVFVEPLAAAFEIKEQLKLEKNTKIGIVGDGRLANLIAMALMADYKLVCFGKHQNKLERLCKLGIQTKTKIEKNDEHTFEVVVEATGRKAGFSDALLLVKPRGTIVLKSTTSESTADLVPAIINEITLVGSRCGPFRPAINALASGTIRVDDMISAVYPLEQYKKAFEDAQNPKNLKILLRP
jgi:threonine dehydrogenase-like Zn-dependent dehydrogenase